MLRFQDAEFEGIQDVKTMDKIIMLIYIAVSCVMPLQTYQQLEQIKTEAICSCKTLVTI
jgi:hypothetical protein